MCVQGGCTPELRRTNKSHELQVGQRPYAQRKRCSRGPATGSRTRTHRCASKAHTGMSVHGQFSRAESLQAEPLESNCSAARRRGRKFRIQRIRNIRFHNKSR